MVAGMLVTAGATGLGCASRWHPDAEPTVRHTVTFSTENLRQMDDTARESFVASLHAAFAAAGLELQSVRYRDHLEIRWTNARRTGTEGVETFDLSWSRLLPFVPSYDRSGLKRIHDSGSCKIQIADSGSSAVMEHMTGDETREKWQTIDGTRNLRTPQGELVSKNELAQERDESVRRVQSALSAVLPDAKFFEQQMVFMKCGT
jgi:hypothetical protein